MQYTTFSAAPGWAMHPPTSITSSIQHICNSQIRIATYNFSFLQLHPRVVESVLHKHCSDATKGVQQQSRSRTGHAPSHVLDHLQMTIVMYVMFSERRFVDAIETLPVKFKKYQDSCLHTFWLFTASCQRNCLCYVFTEAFVQANQVVINLLLCSNAR
jgi:hypothetical protein